MKTEKYKVLIVDDEKLERILLMKACNWDSLGFEVVANFGSANEAITFLEQNSVDIVFTDINMPHMDGLKFVQYIQENIFDSVKHFVIISGYRDFEYARQAIKLGVKEFLLKPVDFDEMEQLLVSLHKDLTEDNLKNIENKSEDTEVNLNSINPIVKKALDIINENLFNPNLSLTFVTEKVFTTSSYLSRLFKQDIKESFCNYIMARRIEAAIKIINETNVKVYEVAEKVGIRDPHYFSICFKRYTGMSISEYKKK